MLLLSGVAMFMHGHGGDCTPALSMLQAWSTWLDSNRCNMVYDYLGSTISAIRHEQSSQNKWLQKSKQFPTAAVITRVCHDLSTAVLM